MITGEHSRVTACTLPEWLSEDIIKQMVDEFGGRLRRSLLNFSRLLQYFVNLRLTLPNQ